MSETTRRLELLLTVHHLSRVLELEGPPDAPLSSDDFTLLRRTVGRLYTFFGLTTMQVATIEDAGNRLFFRRCLEGIAAGQNQGARSSIPVVLVMIPGEKEELVVVRGDHFQLLFGPLPIGQSSGSQAGTPEPSS